MGEKLKEGGEKKRYSQEKKKEEREKRENPAAWSLLLIRAHGLPLINNLSINTTTDVIPKYVALIIPTSNWIDLVMCTTRDTQTQSEE